LPVAKVELLTQDSNFKDVDLAQSGNA